MQGMGVVWPTVDKRYAVLTRARRRKSGIYDQLISSASARDGQTPIQKPEPEQDFLHSGRSRIGFGFLNLCETGLISEFYRNFRSKESSQISLGCKFSRMVRINELLSTQFCVWR